jgi:Fe-S oxidoreductase
VRALRQVVVELGAGYIPEALRISMKNISAAGNPLGEAREKRADWAKGLPVRPFALGMELLYFPCCIPAYDPLASRVARATAHVLHRAGVDFGILGSQESCCAESVRKAGNESLFQSLAQSNIRAFSENGVEKILTTSPHCYNTFKNEYPQLGGDIEVIHYTQYFAQLINQGKLKFIKSLDKRVTYHDPCYLGRHNGIYDEPRQILESIPGLKLIEMEDKREQALCCGGGGGRIWQESKKGERLSDLRLKQAIEVGAEILAVACPYCMLNLADSILTADKSEIIEVKDIAELVWEAIAAT